MRILMYAYMHVCIHARVTDAWMCVFVNVCFLTCACTCVCVCVCVCVCARVISTHTHAHTYVRVHMHTHAHTHTFSLSLSRARALTQRNTHKYTQMSILAIKKDKIKDPSKLINIHR